MCFQTDTGIMNKRDAASSDHVLTSTGIMADLDNFDDDDINEDEGTLLARGAVVAGRSSRSWQTNTGLGDESTSISNEVVSLGLDDDTLSNGMHYADIVDPNDADDEDEVFSRSQKGQYQRQKEQRAERRPSLDRRNGFVSARCPSPDRLHNSRSERQPSLEHTYQYQSERRPSLDRRDNNQSKRQPSLERVGDYRSERRPSLERASSYQSERRPSLERRDRRPSLERRDCWQSERRPSLERLEQCGLERRPSLDRMQSAPQHLVSLNSTQDSDASGQGINTLRPWPLNHLNIPRNWDMTQLPSRDIDDLYCLVKLSPMDREYSAITVDFEEAGLKVVEVERLQNPMLLERFNHEKEHLLKLRPPGTVVCSVGLLFPLSILSIKVLKIF